MALRAVEVERRAARLTALDRLIARLIVAGDGRRRLVNEPAVEIGGQRHLLLIDEGARQRARPARLPAADRDRQGSRVAVVEAFRPAVVFCDVGATHRVVRQIWREGAHAGGAVDDSYFDSGRGPACRFALLCNRPLQRVIFPRQQASERGAFRQAVALMEAP